MKIFVLDQFGNNKVVNSKAVPRVGDKVDCFYEPVPKVTQVLFWPSQERLRRLYIDKLDIDAIITVE